MTPNESFLKFQWLVDDEDVTEDDFYTEMNNAVDRIFIRRPYEFLKKSDDTKTLSGVNITLPTDCLYVVKMWIGDTPFIQISREQRRSLRNASFRFYVDRINNRAVLTTAPTVTSPIYLDYIYRHDLITTTNKSTDLSTLLPGFERAFHPLIAYEAAKKFYFRDGGNKSDSWDREHAKEYNDLLGDMDSFDAQLKFLAQGSSVPESGSPYNSNVIDEDA